MAQSLEVPVDSPKDAQNPVPLIITKGLSYCVLASTKSWDNIPLPVKRFAYYEWFYPYIDAHFYTYNEFAEVLEKLKIKRTSKQSMFTDLRVAVGRPRRFSKSFIAQQNDIRDQMRYSARRLQSGYRSQFKEIFQFVNLSLPSLAKKLTHESKVKAWHPIRQYVSKGRVDTETEQGYLVIFDGEESKLFINEFEIAVVPAKQKPEAILPPPTEAPIIKAGVNLYSMATFLRLLERKE